MISGQTMIKGIQTGIYDLDKKLGDVEPGCLMVIAARPAMGKTTMMQLIANNVAIIQKKPALIMSDEMLAAWPYFQTLIDMLEMVLSKADSNVALYYESHLTNDSELQQLGTELRGRLKDAVTTLLNLKGESKLLSNNEVLDQSMKVRKPYLLPLHLLQAELMKRRRAYLAEHQVERSPVDHALMVSIAGIAAGLRNTG